MSFQEEAQLRRDVEESNRARAKMELEARSQPALMAIYAAERKEAPPEMLAQVAQNDLKRLEDNFYGDTPRPTIPQGIEIVASGKGPKICMKQGFSSFKGSYTIAENFLSKVITPKLRETGYHLNLVFVYCLDYDENPFGDWGQHHWRIVKSIDVVRTSP